MILKKLKTHYLHIIFLLIIGMSLSFIFFLIIRNNEKSDIRAGIILEAQRITHQLQRKIDSNIEALQSCYSFFISSEEVTREEFAQFVSPVLARHTIIQAIAWIPKVANNKRKDFETSARRSGISDYVITEQDNGNQLVSAKSREVYYPVLYIEPVEGNEKAFGYDLSSNSIRYNSMLRAMNKASITASQKLKIVQEKNNQKSILVFIPLYKKNTDIDNIDEKHDNLLGFVTGVYRLPQLLSGEDDVLKKKCMNVFYYDNSSNEKDQLVYEKFYTLNKHCGIESKKNVFFSCSFPVIVADRTWNVEYEVDRCYFSQRMTWNSWIILLCSLIITGLIVKYLVVSHIRTIEVQELAEVLIDKNQELENVNQELDTFVYTASHDLSSPLRTINSFANVLKEDYYKLLPDDGKDFLNRIIKGTNQMDHLIKDLLELSRTSRIKNPYEYVDFNKLVESVKERVCLEKGGLDLRFKIMDDFPEVYCDPIKIREVFFNLINNALKFSTKKENQDPSVEVGYLKKNNDYEFYVKDNGIGIEEKYREKIFDIFVRLHPESEYEGTGLGLTIVKKIINEHSGRIWVESEENKGAVFFFTLPGK